MESLQSNNKRVFPTSKAKERIGMTKLNKKGEEMTIVSYKDALNIEVRFKGQKELIKTKYQHFIDGNIKRYSIANVYGHGIIGLEHTCDTNGDVLDSYSCWKSMIQRCFSEKEKLRHPTYRDVTCCDEWIYYSNFKKFYDENYYEVDEHRIHLDKDILVKGNKIYSPQTCMFVPQNINTLFIKREGVRGKYPIGVSYNKPNKNYTSNCRDNKGNRKLIGSFNTPEQAFYSYKESKENNIKQIAEEYKLLIPMKLYEAMCEYKVEITD